MAIICLSMVIWNLELMTITPMCDMLFMLDFMVLFLLYEVQSTKSEPHNIVRANPWDFVHRT